MKPVTFVQLLSLLASISTFASNSNASDLPSYQEAEKSFLNASYSNMNDLTSGSGHWYLKALVGPETDQGYHTRECFPHPKNPSDPLSDNECLDDLEFRREASEWSSDPILTLVVHHWNQLTVGGIGDVTPGDTHIDGSQIVFSYLNSMLGTVGMSDRYTCKLLNLDHMICQDTGLDHGAPWAPQPQAYFLYQKL